MLPFRAAFLVTFLGRTVYGLSQEYCSTENTGSDLDAVYNIYQSNGACYDQCKGSYAFAIVQYQNCWCSNYIPADQQNIHACNEKCPGYPDDLCGSKDRGLYGYIQLPNQASGTAGAAATSTQASATTSSAQPSTTEQPSSTSQVETSSTEPATSYTPSTTSTSEPPTTTSSSSTPESTSTPPETSSSTTSTAIVVPVPATTESSSSSIPLSATPSPVTSVRVVTVSGAMVTQTVTSTPMVAPDASADSAPLHRKALSGGAIAGIVIGTLLGLAALLIGAFFLWRRRRDQDPEKTGSFHGPNSPRRNVSVLSKTGLLNRGRPMSITEKDYDEPLYVNTHTGNSSVRHSMLFCAGALGVEGVSPVSPLGSSHDNASSRRHSKPLVYDQRLNPSALFANAEANGSRVSIQDQHDYSRPLGVMNPDPRASFESRRSHR